jgi:hypothetical protein
MLHGPAWAQRWQLLLSYEPVFRAQIAAVEFFDVIQRESQCDAFSASGLYVNTA